jgi:predicted nucleic acid-binding Zn ribbon protein
MPVYVYRNLKTGETFELEQRITESALSSHPQTGDPVKRLIQPVGIAFKGSGFYVTDSRNSKSASKSKVDADSSQSDKAKADSVKSEGSTSDSGKADTTKSETKSETKTEKKSEPKSETKPVTKSTGSSST